MPLSQLFENKAFTLINLNQVKWRWFNNSFAAVLAGRGEVPT
jgi:hypothetical protein